jgi:hypothetical protein
VPRKTVIELSKLLGETDDPITIDILANQVRFSFGNIELTSKVIDGKFPDYNRVIPTHTARSSRWIVCCCCTRCNARRSCRTSASVACASACIRVR